MFSEEFINKLVNGKLIMPEDYENEMKPAPGKWDNEPDELRWTSESGYECLVLRHDITWNLNGYVRIPEGHPFSKLCYDEIHDKYEIDVHGGLTFSGTLLAEKTKWIGFDTCHSGDYSPKISSKRVGMYGLERTYKNIDYVKNQCEELAWQCRRAENLWFRMDEFRRKVLYSLHNIWNRLIGKWLVKND